MASRLLSSSLPRFIKTLGKNRLQIIKLPTASLSASSALFTPRVQKPAPDFHGTAVVNNKFAEIKLSDYQGKYLVLFFYPLAFTFVCPTELVAFSESAHKFKEIDTEIVAASIDSHYTLLAWINTPRKEGGLGQMKIPLLSDMSKNIARDYDVLIPEVGIALRGLFIIDPKGIIRHLSVNDLPVGRSVDETLRLVQAFQFVDKHGEVCPADWKPEKPTIKPDPTKAKEFFGGVFSKKEK